VIEGVLSVAPTDSYDQLAHIRDLARYRTAAVRACGTATAAASLVVFIGFPWCQLPCGSAYAFATQTTTGWKLWISYRVG
jgi:hypothetical protein